jgi:hypothetical protein
MKRGQVSIFLVIVIILIILSAIYFTTRSNSSRINIPDQALIDFTKSTENYIEGALYHSLEEGLKLIGDQGGFIFESQGGYTNDIQKESPRIFMFNQTPIFVPIEVGDIDAPKSCMPILIDYFDTTKCPSVAYPFTGVNSSKISFSNLIEFPFRLNNRLYFPSLYAMDEEFYITPDYKYPPPNNIYYDLKYYIENELTKNLNFSNLGQGMEIIVDEEPIVNLIFSMESTSVTLKWPITVVNSNGDEKTITTFNAKSDVKVRSIYLYLNKLLTQEANNFSFDLTADNQIKRNNPDLSLSLKEIDDIKNKLLEVTQIKNGEEIFKFNFILPNSPPAMSYIHYDNIGAVENFENSIEQHCPYYKNLSEYVWTVDNNSLSIEIGRTMKKHLIECIFWTYESLIPNYKRVFDPDDDNCTWKYKLGNCNWDEDCIMEKENLKDFPNINLMIEFNDSILTDYMNMTLKLKNFGPDIMESESGCEVNIDLDYGFGVYTECHVRVMDLDTYYGDDVDSLEGFPTPGYEGDMIIQHLPGTAFYDFLFYYSGEKSSISFLARDKYGIEDEMTIN